MTTNPFFNNFYSTAEQGLVESLIIESIKMYGLDMIYLPRTINAKDEIFREPELIAFNSALPIEMYIKNVNGWGGEGKFLSKFGLEIRDEVTLTVAQSRWKSDVGTSPRPNEGDLIWFPLNKKCFQITYVNHEVIFYQLGGLQVWDLTCELFEFSNEVFNTGNAEIDARYSKYSTDMYQYGVTTEGDFKLTDENGLGIIRDEYDIEHIDHQSMNDEIQKSADEVMNWDETDPFSEKGRY